MAKKLLRKLMSDQRGATLVEFALVVLLLLTFLFGIIEFGWIFHGRITISGAVREGARVAIVSNHSSNSQENIETEVKNAVLAHAGTFDLIPEDINIVYKDANGNVVNSGAYKGETSVEVSEARLRLLTGSFLPFINDHITFRNVTATMMHE